MYKEQLWWNLKPIYSCIVLMYIFQVLEYFHFCYFTYWRLFNDVYLPATWKGKHEIQWSVCFGPGFRNEERKSEKHLLNNILLLIFLSRLSLGLCSRCRCELSASETLDRCRVWSPARPLCLHLLSPQSLCDLKALCWCEKAVVVSCRPAWRPPCLSHTSPSFSRRLFMCWVQHSVELRA